MSHQTDQITQQMTNTQSDQLQSDKYAWLEEIEGKDALDWVNAQNQKSKTSIADTEYFSNLQKNIRDILDSKAKIPYVEKYGAFYYNFWRDANHIAGIWRRTTLEEYMKPEPVWETVLDIDELNKQEGKNYVWHDVDCYKPDSIKDGDSTLGVDRCLVSLSKGGSDADETREFSLVKKEWVVDGFYRPESKGGMNWKDADTLYLATDFGPGSMTTSGYPRIVKEWKRGTPMTSAEVVYEGQETDMMVEAERVTGTGWNVVTRHIAFYNDELYLRTDTGLQKMDLPNSASKNIHDKWLTLELRSDWVVSASMESFVTQSSIQPQKTYTAGSLLVIDFKQFLAGHRDFKVVFSQTDSTSLQSTVWTKNYLVLNVMEHVKNKIIVLDPASDFQRGTRYCCYCCYC